MCEGTRERKKSEVAEQGLLQSQGREEVQGQRSPQCWGSLQPRQDGARPTLRGQGAKEPAASTLSSRVRASEAGAGILPASFPGLSATAANAVSWPHSSP